MDVGMIIFLVVVVFVFGYAVLIYNNLVNLKHAVSQAWSNIDVLLKQRHEELPKLVETCKQYMKHERETLEEVMRARAAVSEARAAGDVGGVGQRPGQRHADVRRPAPRGRPSSPSAPRRPSSHTTWHRWSFRWARSSDWR